MCIEQSEDLHQKSCHTTYYGDGHAARPPTSASDESMLAAFVDNSADRFACHSPAFGTGTTLGLGLLSLSLEFGVELLLCLLDVRRR
jgi:hypothetical protein